MESTNKQQKNNNATWLSVPQFGDWEHQGQVPDYSFDFSKIRETRKQNKTRASRGNEGELYVPTTTAAVATTSDENSCRLRTSNLHRRHHEARSVRRSILSYFNCCAKA